MPIKRAGSCRALPVGVPVQALVRPALVENHKPDPEEDRFGYCNLMGLEKKCGS